MSKTPSKLSDIIAKQATSEETKITELGDKALEEFSKINNSKLEDKSYKFLNGNLRTEINKTLSIRITEFQDAIIQELAKKKNYKIKQLILETLLSEAKKENII